MTEKPEYQAKKIKPKLFYYKTNRRYFAETKTARITEKLQNLRKTVPPEFKHFANFCKKNLTQKKNAVIFLIPHLRKE